MNKYNNIIITIFKFIVTIIFIITIIFSPLTQTVNAETGNLKTSYLNAYYHKQLDDSEYKGEFSPKIKDIFGDYNIRMNFCGVMSLANVLDIMSERQAGKLSGITPIEMVNRYFVDEHGKIVLTYKNSEPAFNSANGSMSHTALYWMTDKIGKETNLWETSLIFGNNNSAFTPPVKKDDLNNILRTLEKDVLSRGGIAIFAVMVNGEWNENFPTKINKTGYPKYLHFVVVTDARITRDSVELLIVDSMGSEHKGYYGWVNSDAYTFSPTNFNPEIYTGILNIYGIVPIK